MTREKVIYSIERCICHVPDACRDCAYDSGHPYNECVEMLLKDVLELLKEQEAVKPMNALLCGQCGCKIYQNANYCYNCGRKIKWDD